MHNSQVLCVGAEGSEGGDLERMLEGVQLWSPYGDMVLLRSLATKENLVSHWWGGYDMGAQDCTTLWSWLIRGFANYNQVFCAQHVDGAMFNPDYSYRAYFETILPELQEIQAGPALLLRDARVVSDRQIATHFSRESEHASLAINQLATRQDAQETVLEILKVQGRDYRYVTSKQILAGRLRIPRAKVLFLPSTLTLSEAAADGIRDFVHGGGMVVADFLPPLDEFGRRLSQGRLDTLFGATCAGKTSPMTLRNITVDAEVNGKTLKLTCPETVTDAALMATDAQICAHAQQVPLMLVNRNGRGKTVLLNFDLSRCPGRGQAEFGAALLRAAGASPQYRPIGPPSSMISVLRRGSMTLLGAILPRQDPQNPRQDATISWAKPMHVYDVRSGRYLGCRNEIGIYGLVKPQRVHLFTLQTLPLTALKLEAPEKIDRGQSLDLQVNVNFGGGGDPREVDRVVRIDVADPNGQMIVHYRDFLTLTETKGQLQIPFAFNDLLGRWTITAMDIATGISASKTVTLHE